MTIDEIRKIKAELGYSNKVLAERAGIPLGTLQKVLSGATKHPRRETILALSRALNEQRTMDEQCGSEKQAYALAADEHPLPDMLEEAPAAYGPSAVRKEEGYTLEDYLALPEERRVELIDGVFYDMAAPTTVHQAIAGFLYKYLLDFVLEHEGPCMPFISPVDVQLDQDDRTVVQPDVLIVCDRSRYRNGRVFGAPDFLVEVLSPSTRKKDMQLKLYKYANAGVREYWIIDPDKRVIVVYNLEQMEVPVIYSFQDSVPVGIWQGECRVDFKKIYEKISFLYE